MRALDPSPGQKRERLLLATAKIRAASLVQQDSRTARQDLHAKLHSQRLARPQLRAGPRTSIPFQIDPVSSSAGHIPEPR
jgi:hypothetical protein